MADEIKRVIEVDTAASAKTVRDLMNEVETLKNKLRELEEGTAEYAATAAKAAKAEKELDAAFSFTESAAETQSKSMEELRTIIDETTGSFAFLVARSQELKVQIDATNERIKYITKEYDAGRIAVSDYNSELQEQLEELQKLKTEQSQVRSALNASTKSILAAKGSYVEMSQTLGQLRAAYRDLSKEARNSSVGADMLAQIAALDTELKGIDASMGNFQRSVGGYEEALKQVLPPQAGLIVDLGKLSVAGGGIPSLFKGITSSIGGMTKAAWKFVATPLGAAIAAVTAAGAGALALFNLHNKKLEDQAKKSADALERQKSKMAALDQETEREVELLRAEGKELKARKKERDAIYKSMVKAQKAADDFGAAYANMSNRQKRLNAETLQSYRDLQAEREKMWNQAIHDDDVRQRREAKEAEERAVKAARAAAEATTKVRADAFQILQRLRAETEENEVLTAMENYQRDLDNFNKTVREKGIDEEAAARYREALAEQTEKNIFEIRQKYRDKEHEELMNYIAEVEDEDSRRSSQTMDAFNRNMSDLDRNAARESLDAEATITDPAKLEKTLQDIQQRLYERKIALINEALESGNIEFEEAVRLSNLKADLEIENERRVRAFQRKTEKEEREDVKKLRDFKLNIAQSTLNSLASIIGEETAAGKAAAVASATIDTYKAANAAYSSMAGIPVVGPGLGAAAAAAAIVAGIANVKKILETQTSGAGSGTAGSPSPSVPAIVQPPAVIRQVPVTRSLTSASEEERLNRMASDQRVYLVYSDVEQAGRQVRVQQEETTF